MESLVRYFAVALARRGITVNSHSPGVIFGCSYLVDGGVLVGLPPEVQQAINPGMKSDGVPRANWDPAGRRECNDAHLHGGIELDDRPDLLRGWRRFDYGHRIPVGNTGSRMNTGGRVQEGPEIKGMAPGEMIYEGPPRK